MQTSEPASVNQAAFIQLENNLGSIVMGIATSIRVVSSIVNAYAPPWSRNLNNNCKYHKETTGLHLHQLKEDSQDSLVRQDLQRRINMI
ncbi:hypothetical protein DPMN_164221 [Dreissena polymorpha]|uniref:Uncharacterized protein n=1 Tax=Dreissena polymorpha TaxID=45954 RepID=A0A9D4EUT5_DREPO|nr:hypothetical protein DPMN_164221 [Dreissena polymorpha]